jgi:excisionase family DNA binding protein
MVADRRRTYTVPEVAALLGISRSTAYECVRRGEIPSRRFGRRMVVLQHDLEGLLTSTSLALLARLPGSSE